MKKSAHDAEKKLVDEMQEFMTKHLGITKGSEFHLLDVINLAKGLKRD
jgi:hypothetical protein